MITEGFHAFLDVVRQGHPTTPIVVISPVLRPDAEDVPNKLEASLSAIRQAIELAARDRIRAGDASLSLVVGDGLIDESHLADGIHPGDEGHKRIAAAMVRALGTAMETVEPPTSAPLANGANPYLSGPPRMDYGVDDAIDSLGVLDPLGPLAPLGAGGVGGAGGAGGVGGVGLQSPLGSPDFNGAPPDFNGAPPYLDGAPQDDGAPLEDDEAPVQYVQDHLPSVN